MGAISECKGDKGEPCENLTEEPNGGSNNF